MMTSGFDYDDKRTRSKVAGDAAADAGRRLR